MMTYINCPIHVCREIYLPNSYMMKAISAQFIYNDKYICPIYMKNIPAQLHMTIYMKNISAQLYMMKKISAQFINNEKYICPIHIW